MPERMTDERLTGELRHEYEAEHWNKSGCPSCCADFDAPTCRPRPLNDPSIVRVPRSVLVGEARRTGSGGRFAYDLLRTYASDGGGENGIQPTARDHQRLTESRATPKME